jgi:4,5-dihydroxyphthalate decarboxylase
MLGESKAWGEQAATPDFAPFGIEAVRRPIELIARYAQQQQLIPRSLSVDELFGETMREFR